MPVIELETFIAAPQNRVFDLARSIELHMASTRSTGETPIAGVTTGLLGLHQTVTWRARHFGVWQRLTVKMTAFDRPVTFTDVMVSGAFKRMEHTHRFVPCEGGTTLFDHLLVESPLGPLGAIADKLVITRYMREFLMERNRVLKGTAEGEEWRQYLPFSLTPE